MEGCWQPAGLGRADGGEATGLPEGFRFYFGQGRRFQIDAGKRLYPLEGHLANGCEGGGHLERDQARAPDAKLVAERRDGRLRKVQGRQLIAISKRLLTDAA